MKTRSTFANLAIGDLLITAGSMPKVHRFSTPHGTINVVVEPELPSGEIQIRQGDKVLGRIVGVDMGEVKVFG